jgi:hypothetical protein
LLRLHATVAETIGRKVVSHILALIPAYNEALHIADVVAGVRVHLPVVVVDDGSTDNTAELAEDGGATVVRQSPNQGKGTALRCGFTYALDQGYEAVVTLDADGQHDPAEIPEFLHAYGERQADLIIGARTFSEMPLVRRVANATGTIVFSWAIGHRVRDNQSGYRLLTRPMMEATLNSAEHGFEFEVEMIVTCIMQGLALDWVSIRTIYAGETSHIHPWHHLTSFFRVVWQARQRVRGSARLCG